jgi:leader peptidase (prepilin peptidase)/N-methyltransferase
MIEFLTALLFLAVELKVGWTLSLFLRHWPWVAILIAVTFIDLEHRIIPDALSLGGSLLGLATASLESEIGWRASAFGFVLGFGVFYLMGTLYYRIRGRSGIGGGDIKLLGMIGAFLGVSGVFATVLVSSTLGSGVGIVWALSRKSQSWMNFAIPYGPFLVLGALCYYLLGNQLWFQFMIPI